MTDILVVDDSMLDCRLVERLLQPSAGQSVRFAEHGAAALELIQQKVPDLVITDLIMPEVDGLELVGQIRNRYPLVPVILMTSKGNEETAVAALRLGAASYVSKRTMPKTLVNTVGRVLAASRGQQDLSRLMQSMTQSEHRFVLENDSRLIPPLVNFLQDVVTSVDLCDQSERTRVGVALEEALMNALYHGNLEIDSELFEDDTDAYYTLVGRRRDEPPFCERRIHVRATVSPDRAAFVVRDEGPGFCPENLSDPRAPENLDKISGRGVLLMRTFMDEVTFNETGNQVTLVKRTGNGQSGDGSPDPSSSEDA